MVTKRAWLLVLTIGLVILIVGSGLRVLGVAAVWPHLGPDQPWTLTGRVYEGVVGDESSPLEGVMVSLYGANEPYPTPGTLIVSTVTDGMGAYGLEAPAGFEYYYIVETDPNGLASAGATSVSGIVRSSNWIEYSYPPGPTLTGNKFWDRPEEFYFGDDFADGNADGWDLGTGWSVVDFGGEYALRGNAAGWAVPNVEGWVDYKVVTEVRLDGGTVHLNFRQSQQLVGDSDWEMRRYYLALSQDYIALNKQIGSETETLYEGPIAFSLGDWHLIRIQLEGRSIQVYVDGIMVTSTIDTFTIIDPSKPLLYGKVGLEIVSGSTAWINLLMVTGIPLVYSPPGYQWTRTGGPPGGLGYDVRIHPSNESIMFVTDNPSGVNKSYDGGDTWVQRNGNINARTGPSSDEIPIFSLTIDPSSPNIVWAGTQDIKGIYRSTDTGESWLRRDTGVTETNEISFRNFGIHPSNSNIVFGGAEIRHSLGLVFDQTEGKIYKSTNGGQNWYSVWKGNNLVRFVLFNYNNAQIMYASTGIFDREAYNDLPNQGVGVGLLKSTDGGENWVTINNGIPAQDGNWFVGFLDMHPSNPQILFAASGNNVWGNGGVFRTTDGGSNWTEVLGDDIFTVVVFSPSNPQVVYAGSAAAMYRSDDGGDNWTKYQKPGEYNWGPPGVRAGVPIGAVVDPDQPMTIFVNNYQGGNFKSTDGGQTWVEASRGYTGAKMSGVAVHPSNPTIVYAIGRSGPFRSLDSGVNWVGLSYSPASSPEWNTVVINPDEPNEMFISDELRGVIYKSSDAGRSWKQVYDHPIAGTNCKPGFSQVQWCSDGFHTIAYAPSNTNIVYGGMRASRRNIDGNFVIRPSYGMFKSTDAGENWVAITTGLSASDMNIHAVAVHPTNPSVVYVGTWQGGLYKSTDGGGSWTAHNSGLTSVDVRAVAIDPNNPQVVYAGLSGGVGIYKSTNGGGQWTAINNGVELICPSQLLPIGGAPTGFSLDKLPAIPSSGIYASTPWTSIRDIVIDPSDSQTIYAADHHSGVYLSTNGGGSWTPINEGLTMKAMTALDISSDGQVVYAATWGGGVFCLGEAQVESVYLPLVTNGD